MKLFSLIAAMAALSFPLKGFAICLTDCVGGAARPSISLFDRASVDSPYEYREGSHDTGDVKNSIMGDMEIRIGHDDFTIDIGEGGEDNTIDASINSTIILGDMKR